MTLEAVVLFPLFAEQCSEHCGSVICQLSGVSAATRVAAAGQSEWELFRQSS